MQERELKGWAVIAVLCGLLGLVSLETLIQLVLEIYRPRVKGKIERPFRDLKRGFLSECDLDPPEDVGELNRRALMWLGRHVHPVVHGTTKERPAERIRVERPLLAALPPLRFDTAVRDTRRVGRVPLVEWDTVFYSAPPELAGKVVEVRQPVGYNVLELRFLGRLEAIHQLAAKGSVPQWLPEHRAAAERAVLGRRRLLVLDDVAMAPQAPACAFELEEGDYDVAVPDLAAMGVIGPHPDIDPPVDIASPVLTADDVDPLGGGS
jgi:hypothetical protein